MKILITKAVGFAGSHLAPNLLKAGYAVRSFIRRARYTSALEQLREDFAKGDFADSVREKVPFRDTQVYYSAVRTSRHDSFRKEVIGLNCERTSHVSVPQMPMPPHQAFPF